jgi:hypothetical protein
MGIQDGHPTSCGEEFNALVLSLRKLSMSIASASVMALFSSPEQGSSTSMNALWASKKQVSKERCWMGIRDVHPWSLGK